MTQKVSFYTIQWPVAEMRAGPSSSSEVISQAYFSERIHITQREQNWVKVVTLVDHYTGWVLQGAICERDTPYVDEVTSSYVMTTRLAAHVYSHKDTIYGPIITLPFESQLKLSTSDDGVSRWIGIELPSGETGFIQRGDIHTKSLATISRFNLPKVDFNSICAFSKFFQGIPYTWGGRTSFGYDCSGYVQMLYRQMGIYLPRDAKDQFICGKLRRVDLKELEPGDLLFFGAAQDKIQHVAFYLNEGSFIHTSAVIENAPYVRISSLTDLEWNGSGYYPYRAASRLIEG